MLSDGGRSAGGRSSNGGGNSSGGKAGASCGRSCSLDDSGWSSFGG